MMKPMMGQGADSNMVAMARAGLIGWRKVNRFGGPDTYKKKIDDPNLILQVKKYGDSWWYQVTYDGRCIIGGCSSKSCLCPAKTAIECEDWLLSFGEVRICARVKSCASMCECV